MERREGERWVEKEGDPDFCQTANKDGTCTLGVVIIDIIDIDIIQCENDVQWLLYVRMCE